MYSSLKNGLFLVTFSGAVMLIPMAVQAEDSAWNLQGVGIEEVLSDCYSSKKGIDIEEYLVPTKKGEYFDMAFADVETFLYVRSEPTTESEWVGKLYPDDAAHIIGPVGEWTKIQSGSVTGYVYSEYITIGNEAEKKAQEIIRKSRKEKAKKEIKVESDISSEVEEDPLKIDVEKEEAESEQAETEVNVEDIFEYAESKEEEKARLEKEALEAKKKEEQERREYLQSGQAVVDYACKFIGNPYVWGGTSLTNGADCSGFVQSVYKHFGVNLPRTSGEMRSSGRGVSYSEAIPGDIVCYDGHVGIYMGDGQIVNAINSSKGIGILSATYANIITVRRVL